MSGDRRKLYTAIRDTLPRPSGVGPRNIVEVATFTDLRPPGRFDWTPLKAAPGDTPECYEWGRPCPGALALGRAILGDFIGDLGFDRALAIAFAAEFLDTSDRDGWSLSSEAIAGWLMDDGKQWLDGARKARAMGGP